MFTYLLLGCEEASNSSAPLVIGLVALVILWGFSGFVCSQT